MVVLHEGRKPDLVLHPSACRSSKGRRGARSRSERGFLAEEQAERCAASAHPLYEKKTEAFSREIQSCFGGKKGFRKVEQKSHRAINTLPGGRSRLSSKSWTEGEELQREKDAAQVSNQGKDGPRRKEPRRRLGGLPEVRGRGETVGLSLLEKSRT